MLSQEATQGSGGWQALLPDGLGSIRALTNNQGQITNTYDYDAFGNDRTPQPSRATGYGFAGEPVDSSTGLTYLRTRYYDPITGRFTARDDLVQGGPGTQGLTATPTPTTTPSTGPIQRARSSTRSPMSRRPATTLTASSALVGDVQILDINAEDLVGPRGSFVEHAPERAFADRDLAALPKPIQARDRD